MDTLNAAPASGGMPGGIWIGALIVTALLALVAAALGIRRHGAAGFVSGLRLGLGTLLAKELRSRSRGWRPMWLLTGYLVALTVFVAGLLYLLTRSSGAITPSVGTWLFSALGVGSVLLLAFISPALTAGAISGERERRTLDLLLVTRASPLGVVGGKLLGSLFTTLYLLLASLPAFALVYLFGGVPVRYVVLVLVVAAVTAVAHASLGLLLSAWLKRTAVASVLVYLLVFGVVLGLPFVSTATSVARQVQPVPRPGMTSGTGSGPPPAYAYASPLTSVLSVLPGVQATNAAPMPVTATLISGVGANPYATMPVMTSPPASSSVFQTTYVVGSDPATGQPITQTEFAPWVYHACFSGALTLLCLLGATLAVAPAAPWRLGRLRRQPALAAEGRAA